MTTNSRTRTCPCGQEFRPSKSQIDSGNGKYCSRPCADGMKRLTRIAVACPCGDEFEATDRQVARGQGRYCSKTCMYKYRVRPKGLRYEIKAQNRGWYRPGHGPTGGESKPGERRSPTTEFKSGQRRSVQTEFKPGQAPWNRDTRGVMPSESDHHAWLGDDAGYATLHDWVRRRIGVPACCPSCGEGKPLDLSNVSGEYRRDVSDWRYLCRSCHFRYDRENIPGASIARFPERKK